MAALALSACAVIEPQVPEGCSPRYAAVYQPSSDGTGGGSVQTIYTGFDCPSPETLEVAQQPSDILADEPPEPWRLVDWGPWFYATPASLGVDDASLPIPGPNLWDQVLGELERRQLELMRRNVVIRIADGMLTPPGSGAARGHAYLIAPPERLDALINGLEQRTLDGSPAQLMPTGRNYPYRGQAGALEVFSNRNGRVYIVSADRTTQCEGILPGFWATGRFEYTQRHPAIDCQIGRYLPDYDVRISVPAQYHAHIGALLTEADAAGSTIIGRAGGQ